MPDCEKLIMCIDCGQQINGAAFRTINTIDRQKINNYDIVLLQVIFLEGVRYA